MRPAGKPSANGDIPPDKIGRFLRESTWKIVYDESHAQKQPRSETRAEMYSTMRDKAARTAALEVLAAPSLSSRGVALRKSHIDIGFERPHDVEARRHTETKQSYIEKPLPVLQSAAENIEKQQFLQKSSIDLAFGVEKTGKAWQTDTHDKMANNVDAKFACIGKPTPIDGTRNYKSTVQLGDNPYGVADIRETESKAQFSVPVNPERAFNYAATLGKELRQHSWDNAMGRLKTTTNWMPAQSAEMARKQVEKFDCSKPQVDPRLQQELRKSSIYMGKDKVDWAPNGMQRALSMPGLGGPVGKGLCRL